MKEITNIKEITMDYIMEYVSEKGEEHEQWLLDLYDKEVDPDKNGKERRISFIEIRQEFVEEYMPELKPIPKEKKPTMEVKMDALRAKLNKSKGGKKR